ncbi:receptor-like cytosolic serine/threonine-protein kinase RBK2 [Selaginella moellendorffii]|nr:receptor-like cytosolic serine/threonine-protein kinase RBK2 [Selaginella moellendorffii]|eukprot:XP_002964491.2 receptor-like cytosolic serine/threonine-protein kinase RBK2 [Selaginella moellendorffii]
MEIESAGQPRQTLKQMLLDASNFSSPRAVLDAPFDHNCSSGSESYYAYADTMSIRTGFLHDHHRHHHHHHHHFHDLLDERLNSHSNTSPSSSGSEDSNRSARCFTVFRRLGTFPSDRRSSRKLRTSSFKLMSKVAPLAVESKKLKGAKWKQFRYSEIESATGCFNPENLIGKGGYADVYKGCLPSGELVAVKRLTRGGKEEQGTSFLTELGVLGHVSHPNATPLLGFCVDGGLFLVFHFLPHGSLAAMLHGSRLMEWPARFKAAIGTARGLHYLHSNCRRRIIHRDIKSSNILLGPDFEPQITDFGLAKWLPSEWTHHTVPVEGTFGYLAPEYFLHGIVDEKTDVFAFGVLLLELVTGLRPIDSTQKSLVMKVRPLLESANIQQLVDGRLKGAYNLSEVQKTILAARLCIRQSAIARPCMADVVKLLVEGRPDLNLSTQSHSLWDKFDADDEFALSFQGKDMSKYKALAFDSSESPDLV